jgi:chromosome segregation ATPase
LKTEREAREAAERKFEMTKEERAQEREKRQKEAEKNEQYEEAKKLMEERLAEMQTKLDEMEKIVPEYEQAKELAEKYKAREEAERKELLDQIPEDRREKFQSADVDILRETVSFITGKKPGTFTGGATHKPTSTKSKWSEMDDATRAQKARELDTDELASLIAAG